MNHDASYNTSQTIKRAQLDWTKQKERGGCWFIIKKYNEREMIYAHHYSSYANETSRENEEKEKRREEIIFMLSILK